MIILACACFFALHIITIERFSVLVDGVRMSLLQFAVCGILSLPAIFFYETPSWEALDQSLAAYLIRRHHVLRHRLYPADPWSKIRQCYFSFHHFKYGIRLFGFRRLAAAGRTAFPA